MTVCEIPVRYCGRYCTAITCRNYLYHRYTTVQHGRVSHGTPYFRIVIYVGNFFFTNRKRTVNVFSFVYTDSQRTDPAFCFGVIGTYNIIRVFSSLFNITCPPGSHASLWNSPFRIVVHCSLTNGGCSASIEMHQWSYSGMDLLCIWVFCLS